MTKITRLFLPFLTQSPLVLTLHGDFQLGSRKGSQMGIFKKIGLRKREESCSTHLCIHWLIPAHALPEIEPATLLVYGMTLQPTGLPTRPKPDADSYTCGTREQMHVSLNFSPHKRIRNNTSPINLLGCEG